MSAQESGTDPRGGPPAPSDAEVAELLRRVAAAVRRTCPPWLAAQAEDITQAVSLQLVRAGIGGEGDRGFSSIYLKKAAYGATVDEIRRRCRRKEEQVAEPRTIDDTPARAPDPERRASGAEAARGIRDCLQGLVKPRRVAVTLYLQGCSVPETATRMRWGVKRAENLVYRGLADLRRCLDAKGLHP